LHTYFAESGKPASAWRVGAEFEKFAVDPTTGQQLGYTAPGGGRDTLHALAQQFHWQAHYEGSHLTTLTRRGASISLEPGGQVELSTAPCEHVGAIAAELHTHGQELHAIHPPERVAWLGAGVTPISPIDAIPLGPRPRHAVMAHYLPQRSPMALHMMKATCSVQAAFDYADEADASRKFGLALVLSPIVNALWANAPLYAGQATGVVSYRGRIWQGMDPARSGLLVEVLRDGVSFARWIDYLLDRPMMFYHLNGHFLPAHGRLFRDYLHHGYEGYFPTRADWEVHLTTVFPDVRMKHFIEVRGADAGRADLALSVPAFWKGLLYDDASLAAALDLARALRPDELPDVNQAMFQTGLRASVRGRSLADWCRELLELSRAGLARQATARGHADERSYLDPVAAVLERGRSPGAEPVPSTASACVQHFAYWPTA
jgi:glutamate--cysteine ligase